MIRPVGQTSGLMETGGRGGAGPRVTRGAARAKGGALERPEHGKKALARSYSGMCRVSPGGPVPEERYRVCWLLRLHARFCHDRPP
jgi:hypothetical protein